MALGSCDVTGDPSESCSITLDGSVNYPRLHVKDGGYNISAYFESNARNYRPSWSYNNRFTPQSSESYAYRSGSTGDDNLVKISVTKKALTVTPPTGLSATYG